MKRTGRPRTGSLEFRGKTWHARLTVTVDGESVRRWFDLGTTDRDEAERVMRRLLEMPQHSVSIASLPEIQSTARTLASKHSAEGLVAASELAEAVKRRLGNRATKAAIRSAILRLVAEDADEIYFSLPSPKP